MTFTDKLALDAMERARAYALSHRFDLDQVKKLNAGTLDVSTNPQFKAILPAGFEVTYTVEQHPGGWYNHLNVSQNGACPVPAVAMAVAIFACRPNGPSKIESKDDACIYQAVDGLSLNVLIPFEEEPVVVVVT